MDQLAAESQGRYRIAKLNVDENPQVAVKYDVMTIPRILFFKGSDTPVHQEIGVLPESEIAKLIAKHV